VTEKKLSIGFDRYIEKTWLDQIAHWVVQGKNRDELHALVDDYLVSFINGATSLRKTKNVLFGVWVNTTDKNNIFKEQAITLFNSCSKNERLAIHWGLAIASYPFFASLARLIGRLLKLQADITSKELVRRSVEQHGDTESIQRATARLLQSFGEWSVLIPESKSLFHPPIKISLDNSDLVTWLLASVFFSSERSQLSTDEIFADPALFPFEISHHSLQIEQSLILEIIHQSAGNVLVSLKK
jgi:elongation factor P hydroxylase